MLTSATGSATSASTVSVARLAAPDAASAPTSHTPAPGVYVPCDATAPAKISPGGSTSSTRTFVASSGPRFVTDTVNRTRSPTVATPGSRVLTVLSTWRSADGPFTVTPLMSLSGTGSSSFCAIRCATLVWASASATIATICSVAVPPVASVPSVQVPVDGS